MSDHKSGPGDRVSAPLGPVRGRRPAVTIVDVAREAGVSHSTVSRVLNDHPHIKDDTRRRVEVAVASLGYVANLPARRLAGGRVGTIGLVVVNLESSYITQIVRAVDSSLADAGQDFMLYTTNQREQRESSYVARLSLGLVDGLIVLLPRHSDRYAESLSNQGFPFVLLDHDGSTLANTITTDHQMGTREAILHLTKLGHHRIACISGDFDFEVGRRRLQAFKKAVADFDLDADPKLIVDGDFLEGAGYRATEKLLDLERRPSAIFASSDAAAFGALRALRDRGVRVPEDMSIIGFDDIPEAQVVTPALTTVRQPLAEMGRRAVQLLNEKIAEPDRTVSHVRLPVELIVRQSTGPVPSEPLIGKSS